MPPKGSKATRLKQNSLGVFQTNKKSITIMDKRISDQKLLLSQLDVQLKEVNKAIDLKNRRLHHRQKRLADMSNKLSSVNNDLAKNENKCDVKISSRLSKRRKLQPTTENLNVKSKSVRRVETMDACSAIHGATKENIQPAVTGMLDTLTARCNPTSLTKSILSCKPSFTRVLKSTVSTQWSKDYYQSHKNTLRSLNTYYSHNVLGKRKYLSIRRANKKAIFNKQSVPNYVPYTTLSKNINQVDIGQLHNIADLDDTNGVSASGVYRNPAEYILRLAKFYLFVNKNRNDKLKAFPSLKRKSEDSFVFSISVGGDGAPICGMSVLVSFMNVGKRLASSDEQFLIFGGDVDEASKVTANFFRKLVTDIKYLESEIFSITVEETIFKIEFLFCELPNDMKMLCFLGGELSNASFYFSTFANVNQKDSFDFTKSFSKVEHNASWKPFTYEKRIKDAEKVQNKKIVLEKSNLAKSTKRTKITSYIANELKSRQEFVPVIGKYIDCAKAEPLHLKNNTVKERFMFLLKICVAQSNLQNAKDFNSIPEESLFRKFVLFVQSNMGCNFLAGKIKTWYNENSGKVEKEFSFRFRGKESFLYFKHFPSLIVTILSLVKTEQIKLRLHEIYFQSIHLRQLISYAVRIENFNEEMLLCMFEEGKLLFKACCLFDQRVSPSMWTLCNVAPVNAEECFKKYGLGLGCNTMEGREQKHQRIAKYAQNTTYQNRWPLIMRHEFLQLVYLRENGYDKISYKKKNSGYVPAPDISCCKKCCLNLDADICQVCDSIYMKKVYNALGI